MSELPLPRKHAAFFIPHDRRKWPVKLTHITYNYRQIHDLSTSFLNQVSVAPVKWLKIGHNYYLMIITFAAESFLCLLPQFLKFQHFLTRPSYMAMQTHYRLQLEQRCFSVTTLQLYSFFGYITSSNTTQWDRRIRKT